MPTMQADVLTQFAEKMFVAAGCSVETANLVAGSLVRTNLAGHDSHGVVRLPQYIEGIRDGYTDPRAEPEIVHETAIIAKVDAHRSLGQVAAKMAIAVAIDKARETQLAMVGIFNCNHIGRLGEWVEIAANEGLAALGFCNGGGKGGLVTPHGGAQRRLGTNPFASAFPLPDHGPIVVDFATSGVAEGKVRVARNTDKQMPPGYILDADGQPSTEPMDLYNGGMLLPVGLHKGYGLGLTMSFMGGILTGSGPSIFPEFTRGNGVVFIVFAPDVFRSEEEYRRDAGRMAGYVTEAKAAPGSDGVLLPGDPERIKTAERLKSGIPIDETTWASLLETAELLGVEVE